MDRDFSDNVENKYGDIGKKELVTFINRSEAWR